MKELAPVIVQKNSIESVYFVFVVGIEFFGGSLVLLVVIEINLKRYELLVSTSVNWHALSSYLKSWVI